jgi:nitrate/nitrite-specific signal transduction histidine kinase
VPKLKKLSKRLGRSYELRPLHIGRSIRSKILLWSFVPTVLVLAAVALVTYGSYLQVVQTLVIERDQEVTRLSAGQLASEFKSYADLLNTITLTADMRGTDPQLQQQVLERFQNRLAVFDGGVIILDNFGKVIASLPNRPDVMRQDWSDRDYFNQMVRSSKPVFSNVLRDGPGGALVIATAVPIVGNQGEMLGAVVGMFRLGATSISAFYGGIVKQRIGEGGITYIVDQTGQVLYHVDMQRIGEDFSNQAAVQRVISGSSGALRAKDYQGLDIVAGYAPIAGTPWGLVTEESWAGLLSKSQGYRQFLGLLLAIGVLVPVVVTLVGVRRITQPIQSLINAAQEIAKGNFDQRITAHTGDEIEELAIQFNRMAEQLQASYAQLEQRVVDRTRELAALNDIAAEVSRSLDLDQLLHGALEKTLQLTQIEAGGFYIFDEESQLLHLVACLGLDDDLAHAIDGLKAGEGISEKVQQTGEPIVVQDISSDERLTVSVIAVHAYHAAASFPLVSRANVLGTLFVVSHEFRPFSQQDISLLTAIGQQVGVAIEKARLYNQAEQRMRELDALYQADEKLLTHLELKQVLQALVDVAVELLQADKSALLTWDEAHQRLVLGAARGFSSEVLDEFDFAPGEGLIGQVVITGKTAIVEDTLEDGRVLRWVVEHEGVRSLMHVPIRIGEQIFGVFNVNYLQPRAFGKDEQRLFLALTQRAALAIENAQLYGQAQNAATVEERQRLARELHDAVTQTLFSASLIAEVLPVLWERKPEEGRKRLEELRQLTRGALAEMRSLLLELRPKALMEAEIRELFRHLVDAFTGRARIPAKFTLDGDCNLDPEAKVAFYRIAQEALNNVAKHAHAEQAAIYLQCNPEFVAMEIWDSGRGFDLSNIPSDHLGLGIMQERAAKIGAELQIKSSIGGGTTVSVRWNHSAQPTVEGQLRETPASPAR